MDNDYGFNIQTAGLVIITSDFFFLLKRELSTYVIFHKKSESINIHQVTNLKN